MKLDLVNTNNLLDSEFYEGIDGYLIDDNKNKVDYHLYMIVRLSDNSAVLIAKKSPVDENADYEIFEFNGNKIFDHGSTRIKALAKESPLYQKILENFNNKQFVKQ